MGLQRAIPLGSFSTGIPRFELPAQRPVFATVGAPARVLRTGVPALAQPGPAHWNGLTDGLNPGRNREYTGETYDTQVVKRVFPAEVYSWEHSRTTGALVDVAKRDAWEAQAVPPIRLAYSAVGIEHHGRRLHYAVEDGHHRLHAVAGLADSAGKPLGVPAMVTSRWTPDESGRLIGYRGMPFTTADKSLPDAWNPGKKPLVISVPESIEQRQVYRTPELKLALPGGSAATLSLADIADKLNAFKRPGEFLTEGGDNKITVRISLSDVYREGVSGKHGTLNLDVHYDQVDRAATDWRCILRDTEPMRNAFTTNRGAVYPILEVRVQQGQFFIDD